MHVALTKRTKLVPLCETRWIQRHNAVLIPSGMVNSICQFQFIVSTFVLSSMLSTTYNLSKALQNKQLHLSQAIQFVAAPYGQPHKISIGDA
ncbi:hypothetical protein PR048_001087 [Dryococelus australis]|uniref:Uncharacterized protein n=1 Tax=Dryococelus australis TaxID=614101 RepID=A0ABQ9IHP8_9NEOP|nr:hypothetical protein PR048_001087 [Dryococelus australis]